MWPYFLSLGSLVEAHKVLMLLVKKKMKLYTVPIHVELSWTISRVEQPTDQIQMPQNAAYIA